MSIEFKIKKAYQLFIKKIFVFVNKFEKDNRFDEYDLRLYDLTKESIKRLDNLPKVIEYAKDIVDTLEANHPEIAWYDYWRHYNVIAQQLYVLDPIAEKMLNDEKFKQDIIQNGFKTIDEEFWKNKIIKKEKEKPSPIVNEFALGTLYHLEKSLMHKIYEEIFRITPLFI